MPSPDITKQAQRHNGEGYNLPGMFFNWGKIPGKMLGLYQHGQHGQKKKLMSAVLSEVLQKHEWECLLLLQVNMQITSFTPLFMGHYLISLLGIKSRTTSWGKYPITTGPAVLSGLQFPALGHYQEKTNCWPGVQNLKCDIFKETKILAQSVERKNIPRMNPLAGLHFIFKRNIFSLSNLIAIKS